MRATYGARAAKTPAALSSGTAIGSSKERSRTDGQRSPMRRRVPASVQAATTISACGQPDSRESRQASRYGSPLTEATTTDSSGSLIYPRRASTWPRASPIAHATLKLTIMGSAVHEPLAGEGRPAGGATLTDDEVRRVPQHRAVGRELPVDNRLPETLPEELLRALERLPPVGGVVPRKIEALVAVKREHVPDVPAKVLGPIGQAQVRARIDRATDHLATRKLGPQGLDPVRRRNHLPDRESDRSPLAARDSVAPELGDELARSYVKLGPGEALPQPR